MYANLRALVRQLARSCSSRELEPRHAKERSLSDSLILTHRDELQKSHSARQLFKKSPSIAHAPIIQQLSAFGRSFNAFARKFLSFCGLFLRFILSAVAVDPQLPQEERPQRESFEHLAHVNSACLPLFRNAEHEALCTVKCFGMAGTRFRSAVWHGERSGCSSSTRLAPRTPRKRGNQPAAACRRDLKTKESPWVSPFRPINSGHSTNQTFN